MSTRDILNATESHFEQQLFIACVQTLDLTEKGVAYIMQDGLSQSTVPIKLKIAVNKFIAQYVSNAHLSDWMRVEPNVQQLGGMKIAYKTNIVDGVEHDTLVFMNGVHYASLPYVEFLDFKKHIEAAIELTL